MENKITDILKSISFDKKFIDMCNRYSDWDHGANLSRKDIGRLIKNHDNEFNYISRDRVFMKEFAYTEYTVRFFISYRGGLIGFGYLVWNESESQKYYKGNMFTLAKILDSNIRDHISYSTPIATSLEDFENIISEIFDLYNSFEQNFKNYMDT